MAGGVSDDIFHVGTGVLDPPRFLTRIARFSFTLCSMEEDEDDEEHPLFRTFPPPRIKSSMLPFSLAIRKIFLI
jgi:hypothetical protein